MDRRLDSLDISFRPHAIELLARAVEAGLAVVIVQTRRTPEEHAANLASGRSRIKHSKHLDGLAIDIAPLAIYDLHGPDKIQWDASDPAWQKLGAIGEALGLTWGGRFRDEKGEPWFDGGHFEMPTHHQGGQP